MYMNETAELTLRKPDTEAVNFQRDQLRVSY